MPRHTAWQVLRSGTQGPLRDVSYYADRAGLEDRDRALVRRIVGTEVRRRGSLRALVGHFARGKPSADLATHMRIGLAQLLYLDQVPPHAAVSETVRATADTLGLSKGRYVNAVLRTAQRHIREGQSGDPRCDIVGRNWHFDFPVFRDPEEHYYLWVEDALSIPSALFKRWDKRLGRDVALNLAHAAQEGPPLSVRAVGVDAAALSDELRASGLDPAAGAHPDCVRLPASVTGELTRTAAFQEGRATIQGETALRAAERLDVQPGMRVLELCSAPGGKTGVLAGRGATVFALDRNPTRMARMPAALARLGVADRVRLAALDGAAGLDPSSRFDGVLVDAPCSNTGVLGARANARWRFGPKTQRELVALQQRLLAEAAAHTRPGGRLVYSTCSLEPEENLRLVQAFVQEQPGWSLVSSDESLPATPGGEGPIDGGFSALLERET